MSYDGKIVASASKDDRAIIRWIDDSKKDIILEHSDDVMDVTISPDNQFVATGCKDGKVQIWSVKDGSLVKSFDNHTAPVTHVTFSPNGKIVASADDYDNVKLWFIDEEKEDVNIKNYTTTDIKFIDDETIILSSQYYNFKVYKVNGELIKISDQSFGSYTNFFIIRAPIRYFRELIALGFSLNNKFLVSTWEDDTVRFWQEYNVWDKEHISSLSSFDQLLSATITRINKNFRKVEVLQKNQDLLTEITIPNNYTFSFSPDNQNLITNSTDYSYSPKLWNIDKGEIALQKNTGSVKNISVSSDGKTIAAINNDNKFIQLWNSKGVLLKKLQHNEVKKLAFSPDNKIVVSVSDNQIKFWTNKGKLIAEIDGDYQQLRDIIFSLDSQTVTVIKDDQVNFFSLTGQLINSFDGHNKEIEKIILSPDKQIIATRSYNQVKLWNLNGKFIKDLGGHYQKVDKVIFSPDSQIIASIGDDNFAKLWRRDGTYIGKLKHIDKVRSLDFSRDSKKITTLNFDHQKEENNGIKLWKSDGTPINQTYDYGINNINLHPDGNFIVSTSTYASLFRATNLAKLWNSDGKFIKTLKGHYGIINDVKFSPDGEIIATASNDKTIKLWSSKDGNQIKTLQEHKYPVKKIMFSPDGNILASIGDYNNINGEEKVIFWDKKGNYLEDSQGKKVSFEYEDNTITSISEGSKCDTLIFWRLDGKNLKLLKSLNFVRNFLEF